MCTQQKCVLSKNVGIVMQLLLSREQSMEMSQIAQIATFAENAIWDIWRKHDPVTSREIVRMRTEKETKGKWPKMPDYKLANTPDGASPTTIAKVLCPGLMSYVYDGIANQVNKLYRKKRFALLTFRERLPVSRDLRIRFRERAVKVARDPRGVNWFKLCLSLKHDAVMEVPVKVRNQSEHTTAWLAELTESGESPSGGVISQRRRRGKMEWQIALSRSRRNGERTRLDDPISDRELILYAPEDQESFLVGQILPTHGRPWRFTIEGHDLLAIKRRDAQRRTEQGRCYAQTLNGASIGHGRRRAIAGKLKFSERYDRRVKSWIEARSAYIVAQAIKFRCNTIKIEDLQTRDPQRLLLGSFPYYQFTLRIQQKAKEAGIKTAMMADITEAKKLLESDGITSCESSVAEA